MNPQQLITAEVMPDGTVKEVNLFDQNTIEWKVVEQNRKVWPMENFNDENGNWYLVSGQHVTGYISDGKFVIAEINK